MRCELKQNERMICTAGVQRIKSNIGIAASRGGERKLNFLKKSSLDVC